MVTSRFLSGREANNFYLVEKIAPKIKGYGHVGQWPVLYLNAEIYYLSPMCT